MAIASHAWVQIQVATHFFAVIPSHARARTTIYNFARRLQPVEWIYDPELRRDVKVSGKVWGGYLSDFSQFRYPIFLYEEFLRTLHNEGVQNEHIEIIQLPRYEPEPAEIVVRPHFVPKESQTKALDFTRKHDGLGACSVLIELPTGEGKTVTLFLYLQEKQQRAGIVTSARYLAQWKENITKYTTSGMDRVLMLDSGRVIEDVFRDHVKDFDYCLISIQTLRIFLKAYDDGPAQCLEEYGGTPFELWGKLRLGVLGGDEMHENLNTVYWLHTFIHGPFHVALSATMNHYDEFIKKRQKEIYPIRFDEIKMRRYINFISMGYSIDNFERSGIRTSHPQKPRMYSQNAYENAIMKNKKVYRNFLRMIRRIVDDFFLRDRKEGDKLALYFSRKKMVDKVLEYLNREFPDLDIRRYIEKDKYENVIHAEIRVTSRLKAGTAVDIPDLTTVISFDNVDSLQGVLQLVGRLRYLEDREVTFVQLYCLDIDKHRRYKERRDLLIADRIKDHAELFYPDTL